MRISSSLRFGITATAAVLIAGCSAASSSSTSASSPATSSPPAATTSASPSATDPSGPQLSTILLPSASMPKGFTEDTSGTFNTGQQLPADTPSPVPSGKVCQGFDQTGWIRVAGISTGDFAQSDYLNADHSAEVAQEIDVFTGDDAQQAMTSLWAQFGHCASFSYPSNGTTEKATLTRTKLTGIGDEAIKAVSVSPGFDGGLTLVAVRAGNAIIAVLDSSPSSDLGAPAVSYATQVAQRLQSAS